MEASVMADRMLSFYFFLFATSIAWWMVRAPSKDVEMKWVEALIRMTIEKIEIKSPYVRPDFFSCCGVISSGNFSRMAAHFRSGVSKQCNFVRVQCEGAAGSATLGYYVTAIITQNSDFYYRSWADIFMGWRWPISHISQTGQSLRTVIMKNSTVIMTVLNDCP